MECIAPAAAAAAVAERHYYPSTIYSRPASCALARIRAAIALGTAQQAALHC
jgi:hypothetical protein